MRNGLTILSILALLATGVPAAFATGDIEAPDTIQKNEGPGNMDTPSKKVDMDTKPTATPVPTPKPKEPEHKKKSGY